MFDAFVFHIEKPNLTRVYIGRKVTVWFSYQTPIAFAVSGYATVKSENVWTQTTARHLNSIAGHTILNTEFNDRLAVLSAGLDDEATNVISRPSWDDEQLLHTHAESIRKY